jgi:hypothetical protein
MTKSRNMRLSGRVERIGEIKISNRLFVGKPGVKRPLGRSDDIKVDLGEIGWMN